MNVEHMISYHHSPGPAMDVDAATAMSADPPRATFPSPSSTSDDRLSPEWGDHNHNHQADAAHRHHPRQQQQPSPSPSPSSPSPSSPGGEEADYYRTVAASLSNSGTYQHGLGNHSASVRFYQEACGVREKALKIDERERAAREQQQRQRHHHHQQQQCGSQDDPHVVVAFEKRACPGHDGGGGHSYCDRDSDCSDGGDGPTSPWTKDRRSQLEAWVGRAVAEEDRLRRRLLAVEEARRHGAPSAACSASSPLDLFHIDVNADGCPAPPPPERDGDDGGGSRSHRRPWLEDPYDWSLGSHPLLIVHRAPVVVHPAPAATATTGEEGQGCPAPSHHRDAAAAAAAVVAAPPREPQQDYVDSCKTLYNMGLVHLDRRADSQAHDIFRMALSVLTPAVDPTLHAHLLNHVALTQARMGRDAEAVRTLNGALRFEQLHFNHRPVAPGNAATATAATTTTSPSPMPSSSASSHETSPPPSSRHAVDVATCVSDTLSLLARTHRSRGELGRASEIAAECLRVRTARLGGAGVGGSGGGRAVGTCSTSATPAGAGGGVDAAAVVHPDVACGRFNLGVLLAEVGRAEEAVPYLDSFVDWAKATLEGQPCLRSSAGSASSSSSSSSNIQEEMHRHHHQGQDQFRRQEQARRLEEEKQQRDLQRLPGLPPPSLAIDPTTAEQLGTALHTVALYHLDVCSSVTRALLSLNLSLAVRRTYLGPSDPSVALTLHSLGRVHSDLGSAPEALACYRESIAVLRAAEGPDHPNVAAVLCDVGRLHHERGEVDEALATYGEALRIANVGLTDVVGRRGRRIAIDRGDRRDYEDQYDEDENDEDDEDDGSTEEAIAELLRIIGNVHLERGDSAEAMARFTEAERMLIRSASAASDAQRRRGAGGHPPLGQQHRQQMDDQDIQQPLPQQQQHGQNPPSPADVGASVQTSYPIVVPITDPNGRGMNFHPCAAAA